MKILFLDIETSPNQAYVWGLWKQNIGINQMIDSSRVMCWSAKWLGDKKIYYSGLNTDEHSVVIATMHALMEEADVIVTYNGDRFDIPTLKKEFLLHGFPPPAPSKSLDLFKVVRKQFKFPSNKLDYICQELGIGSKTKHTGFQLWVDCMNGDENAWKTMERYNKQDVRLLELLYNRLLGWLGRSINTNVYDDGHNSCPSCGSAHLQSRGFSKTLSGRSRRYQCVSCGSWSKSSKVEKLTEVIPETI
jgi:uncharacterized protein YprB with RNaseH-like and TPR domain/predicted RNA-binding Zn-ribbon protein involved in translation (DUF1610 family)